MVNYNGYPFTDTGTEFGELPEPEPTLPEFTAGEIAGYSTRANVGLYHARIVRSRYSSYYQSWMYDLAVIGDAVDNVVSGVRESNLMRIS